MPLKEKINAALIKYREGQAKAFAVLTAAILPILFEPCPEKQDEIMKNSCKAFKALLIDAQYELYTNIALALFENAPAS